jgi:hypothetical protein
LKLQLSEPQISPVSEAYKTTTQVAACNAIKKESSLLVLLILPVIPRPPSWNAAWWHFTGCGLSLRVAAPISRVLADRDVSRTQPFPSITEWHTQQQAKWAHFVPSVTAKLWDFVVVVVASFVCSNQKLDISMGFTLQRCQIVRRPCLSYWHTSLWASQAMGITLYWADVTWVLGDRGLTSDKGRDFYLWRRCMLTSSAATSMCGNFSQAPDTISTCWCSPEYEEMRMRNSDSIDIVLKNCFLYCDFSVRSLLHFNPLLFCWISPGRGRGY